MSMSPAVGLASRAAMSASLWYLLSFHSFLSSLFLFFLFIHSYFIVISYFNSLFFFFSLSSPPSYFSLFSILILYYFPLAFVIVGIN